MTKKRQSLITLAVALLVSLSGCSSASAPSIPVESADLTRTSIAASSIHETDTIPQGESIPLHVTTIKNALENYANNDCNYEVVGVEYSDFAPAFLHYDLCVQGKDTSGSKLQIIFEANNDNTVKKTFQMSFNATNDGVVVKDIITALFMATNKELTQGEAEELMYQLTDSYSTDNLSQYVDNGNFTAVIQPNSLKTADKNSKLYFIYKEEVATKTDELSTDYKALNYDRAMNEMSRGEKVWFNATVKELCFEDTWVINDRKAFSLCVTDEGK